MSNSASKTHPWCHFFQRKLAKTPQTHLQIPGIKTPWAQLSLFLPPLARTRGGGAALRTPRFCPPPAPAARGLEESLLCGWIMQCSKGQGKWAYRGHGHQDPGSFLLLGRLKKICHAA